MKEEGTYHDTSLEPFTIQPAIDRLYFTGGMCPKDTCTSNLVGFGGFDINCIRCRFVFHESGYLTGGGEAYVSAISGDGSVVVGGSENASDNDEVFVWTKPGWMVDLGSLGWM